MVQSDKGLPISGSFELIIRPTRRRATVTDEYELRVS
jgi:hypothetical protein